MKHSPNLDLLRSIAVLLVVSSHLAFNLGWSGPHYDIEVLGRVGVAVFFVHTTLVLMLSLERTGPAPLPFFVRRFFRIYPLAVAAVLILAACRALAHIPFEGLWSNLLLIQNITHEPSAPPPLWSLPYEVQMYIALPALYLLTRARQPLATVSLLWVAFTALVLLVPSAELLKYAPCFLPGVLAFVLSRKSGRLSPVVLFAAVGTAALLIPALVAGGLPETPLLWVLCAMLGFTIPACRQISNRPLALASKTVARYSYGVYLTHWFIIGVAFVTFSDLPSIFQWAALAFMLVVLPCAAYRWIEAPGIALGARLAERLAPPEFRAKGLPL